MIDFRYHLVSLISVFLALAVGIVLGAGPLKESIGDTLTGEVDTLRQRAADLRVELDGVNAELGRSQDAWAAVADDLVEGTMQDRRVAVVVVGDPADAAVEQVATRLVEAGATVTATVRVQDAWTDPTRSTFRQTLAGTLVDYLDPVPEPGSGATVDLAEALVQALARAVPTDPDALAEDAGVVLQLLVDSELVEVAAEVTLPADGIVVVAGPADGLLEQDVDASATPEPEELDRLDLWIESVREIALAGIARTRGTVVAGSDPVDGGLLDQIREAAGTASRVSTVSHVDTLVGQVSAVLALAERMSGATGHYGPEDGATAPVPPRVVLPPLVRVPLPEAADQDATDGDATGDATGDGTGDGAGAAEPTG